MLLVGCLRYETVRMNNVILTRTADPGLRWIKIPDYDCRAIRKTGFWDNAALLEHEAWTIRSNTLTAGIGMGAYRVCMEKLEDANQP
ncbi:MAG TPA: hypothetical protein DEA96_18795 [Leptospiraceae bacterium]|nr:hypothetical protein [Spirochaetaceae bacterium]HBS07027.1 hypothetical protein [Leptospiraceae bacterium]|tara:strand:- start:9838 stop:10098 length:261 start_codon:yes stop_codon:yes gene_type:complete